MTRALRINFVCFLDPWAYSGGGELDNRFLVEAGRRYGHDIRVVPRSTGRWSRLIRPRWRPHDRPDLWVLSDIWNCPERGLSFPEGFIERIVGQERYIHLDNAYVDVCSQGGLPCGGDRMACADGCRGSRAEEMYALSIANVFLSPLHMATVNALFDNRFADRAWWLRPLVDVSCFVNRGGTRDIDYLYVGTIAKYKGYENLRRRFGHEPNFVFAGPNALGEAPFGKYLGMVAQEDMPNLMNRARRLVHLPEWKEPMSRAVVEAALCGCEIIANENVGATSFPFDVGDPKEVGRAASEFWEDFVPSLP